MGVPVIALGVPTVVDFKTIVGDVIESIIDNNQISDEDKENCYTLISKNLPEVELNNIVTPNEIDDVVTNFSKVLADGINMAINP